MQLDTRRVRRRHKCEKVREIPRAHGKGVKCLARWPGSHGHLVSGSYDGSIKIWDLTNLSLLETLQHHSDAVWDIRVHRSYLASSGMDGNVVVLRSCQQKEEEGYTTPGQLQCMFQIRGIAT